MLLRGLCPAESLTNLMPSVEEYQRTVVRSRGGSPPRRARAGNGFRFFREQDGVLWTRATDDSCNTEDPPAQTPLRRGESGEL